MPGTTLLGVRVDVNVSMGWGLSSTGDIFPPAKDKNNLCYSEGLLLKYENYRKNIEARR